MFQPCSMPDATVDDVALNVDGAKEDTYLGRIFGSGGPYSITSQSL